MLLFGIRHFPVHADRNARSTLAGANELQLVIQPPPPGQAAAPAPLLSDGQRGASLRLLLPRIGQLAHPENARTLAQIDWAPVAGEVTDTTFARSMPARPEKTRASLSARPMSCASKTQTIRNDP